MSTPLRIALPSKGRLAAPAERLLHRAGMSFRRRERRLHCQCTRTGATMIFANAVDIPTLIAEGVVDAGISGADLVIEHGGELTNRLALGFGRCRLCLAVRETGPVKTAADLAGRTVGTHYPGAARAWLAAQRLDARLIELAGSLEVMVALGLVDAIVELVETGDSLRANQLVEIAEISRSEAVLVTAADRPSSDALDTLVQRVNGVVIASQYVVVDYNLPEASLPAAREIAPGFHAPTIQQLADPGWLAVKVLVRREALADVMDRLKAAGAEAILATEVANCRL